MSYIVLSNINKNFRGTQVLQDINLELGKGKCYGFTGINGSGKTMLLRIIAGLVIPTSGKVKIGEDVLHENISFPKNMGLIIEHAAFLDHLSGFDNLLALAKINNKIGKNEIIRTMSLLSLNFKNKTPVKKYSLGMKQRLSIAQAIMEKPELIILDEPFNGLDEDGVTVVRNILLNLKAEGKTLIITSHNKEDIDMLCDVVYKLENGKIIGETQRI